MNRNDYLNFKPRIDKQMQENYALLYKCEKALFSKFINNKEEIEITLKITENRIMSFLDALILDCDFSIEETNYERFKSYFEKERLIYKIRKYNLEKRIEYRNKNNKPHSEYIKEIIYGNQR